MQVAVENRSTVAPGAPADAPPVPVEAEIGRPPADALQRPRVNATPGRLDQPAKNWFDKLEAFVSRLSMRDNFWNSVCSLIWLPLAFFSGLRIKELDASS